MISAIFQPEVSALESQVTALQAQLAAAQERITLLAETELLAGGSLESLKTAIDKVSALAPDAIANLRAAVLNLFSGSDNSSEGGNGNNPINPAPQPNDDGGVSSAIAASEEPLNGQLCELTSPWYHPPADAAHIKLDAACTVDTPEPQQLPYVELIPVTHLVAYQRREDGEIICCYLAGNNKSRLKDWGSWLCNQHSVGSGFELREAKRMTAYKWELKIWGMSIKQIQRLAETDTTKTPPSRYHTASMPVAAHLLQTDEVSAPQTSRCAEVTDRDVEEIPAAAVKLEQDALPDPLMFQVGDRVEIVSDRHGVELVGQSGIITASTSIGAAVNVGGTMRWFSVDEVALVESSAPRNASDDLFTTVSAPTPAPAYNPYPMGRRGAMLNWEAYQAAKALEREQKLTAQTAVMEAPLESKIVAGDWVELSATGERCQVEEVTSQGLYILTDNGTKNVQEDEVKLLMHIPDDWKPF